MTGCRGGHDERDEALNVVPAPTGLDLFGADAALTEALRRHGGEHHAPLLHDVGRLAGAARTVQWVAAVDRHPPLLISHDPFGRRLDDVEYHPAWHWLLQSAAKAGLTAAPWTIEVGERPHLGRAAALLVWSQTETGHLGVMTTTYATVPALLSEPRLAAIWAPRLAARSYDPSLRPPQDKPGSLAAFAVAERAAGSDLRSVTTIASPAPGGPLEGGDGYRLTGHKWFCAAPTADAFLVLAQAPRGPTCFLVPRVLPDGTRNVWRLTRLKRGVGHRSVPLAEIELEDTWGIRIGPEGRGLRVLLGPMSASRLDAVLTSAGLARAALVRAVHHARHRRAFGSALADKPLMQNVLADLAVESEAATVAAMRLAAAVDDDERDLLRAAVPVLRYWVCKRVGHLVAEAAECLGGNGWVEGQPTARLVRDSGSPAVWEGTGNTAALDALRTAALQPRAMEVLLDEVGAARGADPRLDAATDEVTGHLVAAAREGRRDPGGVEAGARWITERLAVVLQASLLVRHAPAPVAAAFLAGRLGGSGGMTFGTLPIGRRTTTALVDRALPC